MTSALDVVPFKGEWLIQPQADVCPWQGAGTTSMLALPPPLSICLSVYPNTICLLPTTTWNNMRPSQHTRWLQLYGLNLPGQHKTRKYMLRPLSGSVSSLKLWQLWSNLRYNLSKSDTNRSIVNISANSCAYKYFKISD